MFLLFDIGGTKMRLARSDDGKTFGEPVVVETPQEYEKGIDLFIQTAQDLAKGQSYKGIAGGMVGTWDNAQGFSRSSSNLPNWARKPLRSNLREKLGAPVTIVNDAALVALGEAIAGAGKPPRERSGQGSRIVAYLTVSTGVGGARITNGVIDKASVGFEPGHQIIDADKTLIPDAQKVTLESYVSGRGIEFRYNQKPYEILDQELWNETLPKMLAYGLNNVAVFWSPEIIVLGGSMIVGTRGPTINLEAIERYLKEMLKIFPEIPRLKKAELGDFGGLHGALEIIRRHA